MRDLRPGAVISACSVAGARLGMCRLNPWGRESRVRPPPQGALRSGFTLVEVIVVVGIVAILLAILLPVLTHARGAAVSLDCKERLRQIAAAELMYVNDNRGMLTPRFGDPFFMGGGQPHTNQWWWQARLRGYLPLPPAMGGADPNGFCGLADPGADDPAVIVNCPERPAFPGDSYALNDYMGPLASDYDHYVSPWSYRVSAVPNSSQIIMLGDAWADNDHGNRGTSMLPPDIAKADGMQPAFRHGASTTEGETSVGKANFAFVDGHVESLSRDEVLGGSGHWRWWGD